MKASTLCFRAAVVLVVIGMLWGLQMAISGDHSAHPAHAHLNLLGWVSMALFGLIGMAHPAVTQGQRKCGEVTRCGKKSARGPLGCKAGAGYVNESRRLQAVIRR